jgi:8-oxo-dGTP diphosphatase
VRAARVVAAVVRRGGRILITRRKDEAERGGLWEFPGGKVELGEDEPDALRREIREELGCALEVGKLLLRHSHRYPDLAVELAFYECALPAGEEPRALGVAELEWAAEGTLSVRPFCEADVPVLAELERLTSDVARSSR